MAAKDGEAGIHRLPCREGTMMSIRHNTRNILNTVIILTISCMMAWGCGYGGRDETILIGDGGDIRAEGTGGESAAGSDDRREGPEEVPPLICVYVCGAVTKPGVVSVPQGSRAEDALLAAGGFREDAAQESVNLADWVADGQMLYFPTREEAAAVEAESGLVNINAADAAQLCALPGIGESRAADIIAYREKNGAFESCEDIMKVPGIKTSVYEKIKDKISVK